MTQSSTLVQIYDTLPMVRSLPLPFQKAFKNKDANKKMLSNMLSKHRASRVPGEPRNFVDSYMDELDKVCVGVTLKAVLM